METNLSLLFSQNALLERQSTQALLALNEETSAHGLRLTEDQALSLVHTREESLKKTGRVEFGGGVIERLIRAFCDSPYLSQDNYVETLHALVDLFYEFKNETLDLLSDAELVSFMKQAFDGACAGSIDMLAWQALPALAQHLHEGRSFKSFRLDTEAWV